MTKRYVKMSIWETTNKNMFSKKKKMEEDVMKNTGRKINIPLTSLYDAISRKPITFDIKEIFDISKRRRK